MILFFFLFKHFWRENHVLIAPEWQGGLAFGEAESPKREVV
jgi:hypothetical protein